MQSMSLSAAHHVEAIVIGAGVVGLAAARCLALDGREVIIVEKEASIGSGTSSRNSEVIHAGIYYPPAICPLKARLCVRGKELLYRHCADHYIDFKRLGKLIVASNTKQRDIDLHLIRRQAEANGVTDLRTLSATDVKAMEPDVVCKGALLSPSTGIVDSHSFMVSLLGDSEANGAMLALSSTVRDIEVLGEEKRKLLIKLEDMTLSCRYLINCAGLYAGMVSSMVFGSVAKSSAPSNQRQFFAKGNYYKLEGQKNPFQHLIYPVPVEGGLGVHATIDFGGSARFGPDVEWLDETVADPDDVSFYVDPRRADSFYAEVRKYWPDLRDGGLVPDYSGLRPKLSHPSVEVRGGVDFAIEGPKDHGIDGFVNLLGIESPGLTSSMAIAEEVVCLLD